MAGIVNEENDHCEIYAHFNHILQLMNMLNIVYLINKLIDNEENSQFTKDS